MAEQGGVPSPAELAAHLYAPVEKGGHGVSPEEFWWKHATDHEIARVYGQSGLTHDHEYAFRYDRDGNPVEAEQ